MAGSTWYAVTNVPRSLPAVPNAAGGGRIRQLNCMVLETMTTGTATLTAAAQLAERIVMRRLDRSAGTRRPAGHGVSTQVQRDDDRLPSDAVEADIGRIGQSVLNGTINGGAGYTGENAAFQFVTQNRGPGPVDRQSGRAPQEIG